MKRLSPILLALALLWPVSGWASGTTSFPTCVARFDLTSGNGFLYDECRDLSPWRSGTTGQYEGSLTDSSGNRVTFEVGSAEPSGASTTGAETVSNSDFSAWVGDDPSSFTISSEDANNYITEDDNGHFRLVSNNTSAVNAKQTTTVTPLAAYVWQNVLSGVTVGSPRYSLYDVTNADRFIDFINSGWTAGDHFVDFTAPSGCNSIISYWYRSDAGNNDWSASLWSIKRVWTPSDKGLYIEVKNIDSGFDFADLSGYTVTIRKADKGGIRSRTGKRTGLKRR